MLVDKNNRDNCNSSNQSDEPCRNTKSGSNIAHLEKLLMNISAFSLQGKRSHMEDFFAIGYQLKPEEHRKPDEWPYEYFYFGIFDGHGGSDAAKFAKEHLLGYITQQPDFWSDNDKDILRSIQKGYANTHEAMRKIMHQWPRTHRHLPSTAGTTASVLFIKNGKYYTGHVGDSRIVISRRDDDSRQWISKQLTEDHKPESESEVARIRRAGGDVRSKVGVHRVVWRRPVLTPDFDATCNEYVFASGYGTYMPVYDIPRAAEIASYPICESFVSSYQVIPFLAIARSLGDFWSINPYSGQYIVSPEPDVSCRPIDPNDECILLATDGLWSVVNSHQATRALEEFKAVREGERKSGPYAKQYFSIDNFYNVIRPQERDNYALSLVYLAYQMWERRSLRSDNITAVVAMLGDVLKTQGGTVDKKIHETRSSPLNQKKITALDSIHHATLGNSPQTIGQTRMYNEIVRLDQAPSFSTTPMNEEDVVVLERLGNWLMLPPSAVPNVRDTLLIPPVNYSRLEEAEVRKIRHPNGKSNILIRRVTDDPLDETLAPERTSKKSGAIVRDASAQCTQSIHDFARSWPGENYEEELTIEEKNYIKLPEFNVGEEDDDGDNDYDDYDDDDDDDGDDEDNDDDQDDNNDGSHDDGDPEDDSVEEDELGEKFHDLEDDDQDVLLFDTLDFDVWSKKDQKLESGKPNTRLRTAKNQKGLSKEHMLQPRSENCEESPKFQRKTRSGAYLSLTGGLKRKAIQESPKTKRRKSHPLQCSISRT